jgi:HK97 family phage major capsid protein
MPEKNTQEQEQTIALIEKGLEDIKKGTATKTELLQAIEERKKIDEAAIAATNAEIEKQKSGVDELKAQATEFASKLKQLQSNNMASLKGPDGSYKGLFANHLEAKAFGLMIMTAATAGSAKLQKSHDDCKKALEDMGTKMKWLDPEGRKILTGSSQAGGSALVTAEMIPTLIRLFENYGVFEADALAIPMGSGQTVQPRTDSILDLQCPGEGKATTAQDITIQLISHLAKTYTALTAYSIELDEDSAIPLGELMAYIFARSYGYGIDKMAFLGDGTSTYLGTMGIAGALRKVDATIGNIKSLVVGAGNAYSELTLPNFNSVVGTLPDSADDGNANWYVHRYFYYTVMIALALAAGGVTANEVIMGAGQRQKMYLAYPVRFAQVMPRAEANSQICALLANLKQGAQLGRRGVLEINQSSEAYFTQRLIAVLAARRLSINIHGVGDTTKAGPICALITAAA